MTPKGGPVPPARGAPHRDGAPALRSRAVTSATLPARHKGPVRKYARDFVDSRFCIAEYFLPMAVIILVLSMVRVGSLQNIALLLWLFVIVAIVIDSALTGFRLKKKLAEKFSNERRRAPSRTR